MKRWRKHITCLLLLTFPMSMWAAATAPRDCGSHQASEHASEQASQQARAASNEHANHSGHALSGGRADDSTRPDLSPDSSKPGATGPCCETCLSACLAGNLTVLELRLAALEPVIPAMHYKLDRATQFLPGPSYPSLYRPPIAQI